MADTRFYESAVEFPTIDYGAIYENAKARRELADEKKLGYLNQFQQERSAFAPGIQQEMQKMWNNIQSDLGSGDMSFEAKARRQSMYNNYKDTAAQGLEYSNMLNEYEAQILSDPSSYNSPDLLIAKIQEDRNTNIPLGGLANAMASYPSIGTFRRFSMKEMSPQGAAGNILNNLKTSGGLQNFYDMKGAGGIQDNVLTQTVSDFFSANSLTQEEEDQAIVYMLRQTGALSGNMSDLTNVRNLTEEQRAQKLGDFATYTAKQLKNMIASDIETTREEDARRIRMAREEQVIKNNMEAQKNTANVFQYATGSFDYMPPMVADETGQIKTSTGIKPVVADDIIGNFKITGTQPSYKDINGRTTYIERGGITKDGQQVVVIRYEQDVINTMTSRADKYTAREVVTWSEVINGAGSGLSNMAQASKIQNTFDQLGVSTGVNNIPSQGSLTDIIRSVNRDPNPAAPILQPTEATLSYVEDFRNSSGEPNEILELQTRFQNLPTEQQNLAEQLMRIKPRKVSSGLPEMISTPYGSQMLI